MICWFTDQLCHFVELQRALNRKKWWLKMIIRNLPNVPKYWFLLKKKKFVEDSWFTVLKKIHLFIWLCQVFIAACGIWFPDQGLTLGPVHWEFRVLVTGPPGKSLVYNVAFFLFVMGSIKNVMKNRNFSIEKCIEIDLHVLACIFYKQFQGVPRVSQSL